MRSFLISAAVVCATLAGCTPSASAATITLDATSRGWMRSDGQPNITGPTANYFVGLKGEEYRNFFFFDLTGITDVIVSASLVLDLGGTGATRSPDATETYTLFDVTTPLDTVLNGTGGHAAFDDLASGTSYGSQNVSMTLPSYSVLTMALNLDAIAALQAALGSRFGVGGAITTLNGGADQLMFSNTSGYSTRLVLETEPAPPTAVPEPATLTLLGAGLIALASQGRRRKN